MVITSVVTTVIGDTIAAKIGETIAVIAGKIAVIAGKIAGIDGMIAATIVDLRAGRGF